MKQSDKQSVATSGFSNFGTIPRTELIKKMKEKSLKKNIFLTAPGGYGKTVTASQWLSSVRGRTARLTVGYADNDPGVFYKRLASALLKLTGKEKAATVSQLTLDGLLETIRRLPEKNARCYLALDDIHLIKNEEIQSSLPLLANRLPGYICLCLISRAEPPASLLKTGRFEVFTKSDLLFTQLEIEWLGEEKDRSLTLEQVRSLQEVTGGWAMYLTALLSDDEPDLIQDGKAPKTLLEYLDTRVWGLWDDETRGLLLRLSIPEEITPGLCECLTEKTDGQHILEHLERKENAFLSRVNGDTYRFHDVFHDFLKERTGRDLNKDEIRRLNDVAAGWYYERGDYFTGARHYIGNRDHEGVNRCMKATNRYHEKSGSLSVEVSYNFTRQYVMNLPPDFIAENLYLISECAVVAFHSGDTGEFLRYMDMLYEKLPEISLKYPDLAESVGFVGSLDFRAPLKEYARQVAEMMPLMPVDAVAEDEVHSNTITQNLPFFHRSMRDFSEYHDLREDEVRLLKDTFGMMIGRDYTVMEPSLIAGIYYERGDLLEAARHALNGYHICDEAMQPETVFLAHMTLAAVLYAMGASRDANRVMERMETYVENKALFLRPNFNALQTERLIRSGDSDAAKEWLEVYANRSERLPFYQMCRHFATLRSYIAVKDYAAATLFGNRLWTLAIEYNRPLDQIESGVLTAIALWYDGKENKAVRQLEQAVNIAVPYGFMQLFVNEGKELLHLLWALRERTRKTAAFMRFVDRLINEIYAEYDFEPAKDQPPRLPEKQRAVLSYLQKGMSYNEIADEMGIGHGTAKSYVLLVYKRLGVHNVQEAIVKAKMLRILE